MTPRDPIPILIVDDEPDLVSSLRRILRLDGYLVESASSGSELLARDDLARFFAILLDRKLPDGLSDELLPRLRALGTREVQVYLDVQLSDEMKRYLASRSAPTTLPPTILN